MRSFMFLLFVQLLCFGSGAASENENSNVPVGLQHIDDVVTKYLSALIVCANDVANEQVLNFTLNGHGYAASDYASAVTDSPHLCFWECILTNMDMMKDGHLEYLLPEHNRLFKESFDACLMKGYAKITERCVMAHTFLLCEYHQFLQNVLLLLTEMGAEVLQYVSASATVLGEVNKKLTFLSEAFANR